MPFKRFHVIAIAACMASAHAAPITFFGEDLNGNADVRIAFPNAMAARANFLSQVSANATDTLEEFGTGAQLPLMLAFPGVTGATLQGSSGSVQSVSAGTDGFGRFPESGKNFLASDAASLSLVFSSPVTAFGFYGTDIGDFGGQLSLLFTFSGGGSATVLVPHSLGAGAGSPQDGSVLFFGYLNSTSPFTSVQFLDSAASDTFGFDDPVAGAGALLGTPEPASSLLLGLGLVTVQTFRKKYL